MDRERATSLRRAIELLLVLASDEALSNDGLGVTRLTALLADEKSRVSRTLRTLHEYALVERDPETLAYRLGWRLHALASRVGEPRLLAAAPAKIAQVVREFGESAHLSVRSGAQVVTLVSQTSPRALTAASWVGREIPAFCTSSGRALLLDHDLDELEALFGSEALPPAGPHAPATVGQLYGRILESRAAGYATVVEESEAGLVAAAAPVRDHRGRIVAALNVSAPAFRFESQLAEAGELLRQMANELSELVGWRAPRLASPGAPTALA